MELQNIESVKLPNDIQKKIEAARNRLTLAEQETIRLNELKMSQELQIKENLKKIAETAEDLEGIEKKKETITFEMSKTEESRKESQKKLDANVKESDRLLKLDTERKKDWEVREAEISEKESQIAKKEQSISEKESELEKLIKQVGGQISKIKEFAQSI